MIKQSTPYYWLLVKELILVENIVVEKYEVLTAALILIKAIMCWQSKVWPQTKTPNK